MIRRMAYVTIVFSNRTAKSIKLDRDNSDDMKLADRLIGVSSGVVRIPQEVFNPDNAVYQVLVGKALYINMAHVLMVEVSHVDERLDLK